MKCKEDWCIAKIESDELVYLVSIVTGHLGVLGNKRFYGQSDGSNGTPLDCDLTEELDNCVLNRIINKALNNDPYLFQDRDDSSD